ncbi:MAG: undecaprenyldiphospho-muramoylpentapeptide beta-N-acetylglucosaminyltransferase [Gammaproteobacteria bacterium]|nr:undecaprenyldiphospho-muramoylpentapeptide beta-N-acetylglucosaminyltransferase [Gammaproteobacteria bacterium]
MMSRVLIMAGGTGGHVFPALAVADVLKQRGVDVSWMGTAKGIESQLVPAAGYPLTVIGVSGLRGKGILGWLLAPFKLVKAIVEAIIAIRSICPDMVLGLGGFASGPGGVAAWILRKPVMIHEQNAIPGLTNRLLSHIAKRVLEAFPNSFDDSISAQWVGNPVRDSISSLIEPSQRFEERDQSRHVLVLGGSLGARALNTVLPQAFELIEHQQRPVIRHQCGQAHVDDCRRAYDQAGVTAQVVPFIDDMADAYAWADLVVCRAGALTLAELSAAGVGAILVPYPYAVDDHQKHNAAALVTAGGARLVNEHDLTAESLALQLRELLADSDKLLAMAKGARSLDKPQAANTIADICMQVCDG